MMLSFEALLILLVIFSTIAVIINMNKTMQNIDITLKIKKGIKTLKKCLIMV